MHQKLVRKAGLLGFVCALAGFILVGCIDEPDPPIVEKIPCTVRFIHAVKDVPAVDIWIDEQKVFSGLAYKANTPYIADIKAGTRFIRVLPAGNGDTTQAIFRQLVSLRSFMKMTAVFYGPDAMTIGLLITQERFTYADELKPLGDTLSSVKLINVNVSEERLTLNEGSPSGPRLIGPVAAYSLSPYTMLPVGQRTFYLMTEGGNEMKSLVDFNLQPKTRYSFIAVGDLANPDLLTLIDDQG
ncbi:MAG: DUF4397 domain-containing protein [Bacteroidota bacterium]|nr:DUF4397 domain-containing protein [Bacteroidota bacterium]